MASSGLKLRFLMVVLFIITFNSVAATTSNPCDDASLRDITDRGSISNTPCVLPAKEGMLEIGYQYKRFAYDGGLQNFPQSVLFFGLPANSELAIVVPNYNQQSNRPFTGFSATTVGVKNEIAYGKGWVVGAEIFLTPSGGSSAFGNQGYGVTANAMASYTISSDIFMTLMVGGSTATESRFDDGGRFNSFNPSLALMYAPTEKMSFFAEVFAQTKTGPYLGSNYNVDCGVLYSLNKNVVLDLEVGQQLTHLADSFNQFIGAGVSLRL